MQVSKKKYKKGGLFGNSQEKFSHMAGAERGFDRKRLRELKRAKRQGESLSGRDAQDLQYMKAVRGDRIKKGIMGGAILGAGALAAGPAIAAKGVLKGIAGAIKVKGASVLAGEAAGKSGLKGLLGKFKKAKGVFDGVQDMVNPDQQATDQDINAPEFPVAKKGMRLKKRRRRRR